MSYSLNEFVVGNDKGVGLNESKNYYPLNYFCI